MSRAQDIQSFELELGDVSRRAMLTATGRAALGLAAGGLLPAAGYEARAAGVPLSWRRGGPSKEIEGAGSLRGHAATKGLLTGFAVQARLLKTDAAYAALVKDQASMIVAENEMKWGALRPTSETYFFDDADYLLDFAEKNRIKLRGHNLCWHRQLPKWFAATATKENAKGLLEAHIATVAGRYAGRLHSWDVVNEAIELKDGRPDGLRDSPWLRLVGDDYIEVAFRAARSADPQALLTYNDYGIEAEWSGDEAKRQAVLLMLRRMRARQVPIDAVGIQSHISAGGNAKYGSGLYGNGLTKFIASVRELDMQVFVTEMDVNDRGLSPDVGVRDAAVAAAYGGYLNTVLVDPAVTAVIVWGVTDKFTWLNYEDSRTDKVAERPLLFDADCKAKPSFLAVRDSFDHRLTIHTNGTPAGL